MRNFTVGDIRLKKEYPKCREYIVREGLQPYLLESDGVKFWDGFMAFNEKGRTFVSGSLARQLRIMARDGCFGDMTKVSLDYNTFWHLMP